MANATISLSQTASSLHNALALLLQLILMSKSTVSFSIRPILASLTETSTLTTALEGHHLQQLFSNFIFLQLLFNSPNNPNRRKVPSAASFSWAAGQTNRRGQCFCQQDGNSAAGFTKSTPINSNHSKTSLIITELLGMPSWTSRNAIVDSKVCHHGLQGMLIRFQVMLLWICVVHLLESRLRDKKASIITVPRLKLFLKLFFSNRYIKDFNGHFSSLS